MNDMNEMIQFRGTENELAVFFIKQSGSENRITRDEALPLVKEVLNTLMNHRDFLSEDEWFSREIYRGTAGVLGFVTEDTRYYIDIKRSSFQLLLTILKCILIIKGGTMGAVSAELLERLISSYNNGYTSTLIRAIDNHTGEGCIILEAALTKQRGLDEKYYSRFNGECINNHIPCGNRSGASCNCNAIKMKEVCKQLCQDNVLRKVGNRYYYTDIL